MARALRQVNRSRSYLKIPFGKKTFVERNQFDQSVSAAKDEDGLSVHILK